MKKCLLWAALPLLLGTQSCVTVQEKHPGDVWGEARQREWDDLKRQKSDLAWQYDEPVSFEFPDAGAVTVRSWFLEGGPGWEYVRARFTYRNTTDTPMERVNVMLMVMDRDGQTVAASRVRLTHPWGLPLMPGTFFMDEIRVPTSGAHLDTEGWRWTLECRGLPDEVFGAPAINKVAL